MLAYFFISVAFIYVAVKYITHAKHKKEQINYGEIDKELIKLLNQGQKNE